MSLCFLVSLLSQTVCCVAWITHPSPEEARPGLTHLWTEGPSLKHSRVKIPQLRCH